MWEKVFAKVGLEIRRSFLKLTHIWNKYKEWGNQIMGETMPQLDISCHQMKSLMPGMGYT